MNPEIPSNPPSGFSRSHELRFLSISTMCAFHRCPRLFFYRYLCDLTHPIEHAALSFGTSMHLALPEIQTGDPHDAITRAMSKFSHAWGDGDALYQDEKRNSLNASRIISAYSASKGIGGGLYELIEPPAHLLGQHPRSSKWEIPFAVYLGDLQVPICGSIDGIVRNIQTGQTFALERKTAGRDESQFPFNFKRHPQTIGYAYFLKRMGLDISGTIVERIMVPNPGKTPRANPKYEFHTFPVYPPEHYYDEFVLWAYSTGKEILERIKAQNFPKDISSCASYAQFGQIGYPCGFMNLCEVENWEDLAFTMKTEEYTPFVHVTVNGE